MTYTQEQLEGFKASFATRRRRQLIATVPIIAAFVAIGLGARAEGGELLGIPSQTLMTVVIVLVVILFAFSFRNWRCPACNRYLGRGWGPRFCPNCGVPLA